MIKFIYIGIGGAIGSMLRYYFSISIDNHLKSVFPFGILFVNLLGAFLIGFLWGISQKHQLSDNNKLFLFTGLLGGFTTFSTFALDNIKLMQMGKEEFLFHNIILSNLLALVFVYIGFYIARFFNK
ncbi:MAG: hypothetical protein A2X12_02115 [Bacteroidetes bacterium GWE2_29_8]|nr:MAG: hypothetical protein A2X12_02115 [Bacteroidetes bacterium GWE2_29_8]